MDIYGGILVKNRFMKTGAGLLAGLLLMTGGMSLAEEKRLGDYIYVPAMSVAANVGAVRLRVEGLALESGSDEPVLEPALAGAEFGVYVFSGDGELTPWANPLYPAERMRIRTGEGETSFTLPQGVEFYLRQESAPQGYLYDDTALYKVEGEEIVVANRMAGELAISVRDTLGRPIAGAALRVRGEQGDMTDLITDENGLAVLRCTEAGTYTVEQTALPEGAFAALRVLVNEQEAATAEAQVALSSRTRVTFEHPASGSVELRMALTGVNANGEVESEPLPGVRLDILGDMPASVVTDESGAAGVSLLEGLYDVRLSYEGEEDLVLPLTQGQMIIESGAATVIELSAARAQGRIAVTALCEKAVTGGSISFESAATGETFGPYAFDGEGVAVTDALPAGEYRVAEFIAPQDTQQGRAYVGGAQTVLDSAAVLVESGVASALDIELLTREKQTFGLYVQQLGDDGEITEERLPGDAALTLLDENGEEIGLVFAQDGYASVEALSGVYTLRMDTALADKNGVSPVSRPFALPSNEEAIVFTSALARLILVSVDENGEPVPGASYSVIDSTGMETVVAADEDARAVTALLAPGELRIETVSAPEHHDEAQVIAAAAEAGEIRRVEIVHPSYGEAAISIGVQSVDALGEKTIGPLPGVRVRVYTVGQDGETLVPTDLELISGGDGMVSVPLKPGMYAASVEEDDLPEGYAPGAMQAFAMENAKTAHVALTCMDAMGGVRVQLLGGELTGDELAQVRFELIAQDGAVTGLTLSGDGFYAGGLPAGSYTLRQTQIPQGYTLAKDQVIEILGGEMTQVSVPLEEYAVLTVAKTGITFNDRMQTYIVPLSGQYGVYTLEDGEMKPFPNESEQLTVWANVTPEQIAQGKQAQLRLSASLEGTTYYLREISSADGFAPDEAYHEVTLRAGETAELSCTVSSDRGFFSFAQVDAATGEHVPGGEYALISQASGETVLTFTLGQEQYQNAMAVPVGAYTLRQTRAGEGYAISAQNECDVMIQPYLTQGGTVTRVSMTSVKIPQEAGLDVIADFYAAEQQGLTLLMVDAGTIASGETLRVPQMTVRVSSENGERTDIGNVVLSGVTDENGGRYMARVEYCLEGGGWQPSDARMTSELTGPVTVSLMDVEDDIAAVRVTYLNAETGEEMAAGGFAPGQLCVHAEISSGGPAAMIAEAAFSGETVYRTSLETEQQVFARSARREIRLDAQGSVFDTVSAGRDGRITGVVFFDENADGVMSAQEESRYAGMTVSLMNTSMETVSTTRTDGGGRYEFSGLSSGEYVLQFEAGDKLVFSSGEGYTQHTVSGIEDKQYGVSGTLRFDGDHTDYVVNAGCIYAAHAFGTVVEKTGEGALRGFDGLNVDVMAVNAPDEEPIVVMTDDTGAFRLSGLLPGEYDLIITLPEGYLCKDAKDGVISKRIALAQGEEAAVGAYEIAPQSSVSGGVYVDEDGDGLFDENAQAIAGVQVALLRHEDGHTQEIARTATDDAGRYTFDGLYDGEYSVLFELGGEWTFTRYGEDSRVYGAVSSSGSTRSFALLPGAHAGEVNVGATMPASLEVFVFADEHADGLKGVYDVGLAGVTLSLIRQENGADTQEITLTTGKDGVVRFEGVAPGEYVLAYQMPGAYRATKQVESDTYLTSCVPQTTLSTGRSAPFMLAMGEAGLRKVIGAMLSGQISGLVYYDNDADARIGEEEPACAGVLVELLDADGETMLSLTTDETGEYAFEGLAPGRYSVRFSAQQECGFSGSERSMTRGGVQRSEASVSTTRSLTVTSGGKITAANAGVVRMGSVSGTLFVDSNADCVMDEAEKRLEGISVHLMNGSARSILMSTVTDAQGNFSFDRVIPGTYLVRVDAPQDYVFSGSAAGSPLPLEDVRDGRGYSAAFELLGGAHAQGVFFGMLTQGTIAGRIFMDDNYDGYAGEGEEGLRGALVTLTDLEGNTVASKTTIRSGEFSFTGLMPGEYALSVSLGEGYVFTTDSGESLMTRTNDSSASLYLGELSMGSSMEGLMIGAIEPSSVSGMVFLDEDNDGRRKDGDAGVSGVMVTLTTLTGADSGVTYTAVTDESGAYAFDCVMPGDAQLRFDIPDGYAFAKKASGTKRISCVPMTDALTAASDAFAIASGRKVPDMDAGVLPVGMISGMVWQDEAYDGKQNEGESGVSGARIALIDAANGSELAAAMTDETGAYSIGFVRPGEYTLAFELPEGMIFTTAGVGAMSDSSLARTDRFTIRMGESVEGVNAGAIVPAGVRGRVIIDWNENGLCEADEPGFAGAVVTVMQGGTIVTSTTTDENGDYAIDTLRPGEYRVRIALPNDALFSLGAQLALAGVDALEGETGEFALAMGERAALDSVPVVLAAQVGGAAWMDADTDGRISSGEAAMTDVTAELLDANGNVLRAMHVDGSGRYAFERLRSGEYAVRFTLGEDALFADQSGESGGSSVPVVPGNVGVTQAFALSQEDVLDDLNVGGILPGRIGDTVFLDENGNGMMDYREAQLAGVTLQLMRVEDDGTLVQAEETVSDSYGYYAFDHLRPGSYVVRVPLESEQALTIHLGGALSEIDSDANPDTGDTEIIQLVSGQTLRNVDIGFVKR